MDISIKNTENSHDDANLLMKAPSQIYGQLAGLETQKKKHINMYRQLNNGRSIDHKQYYNKYRRCNYSNKSFIF